MIKLNTIEDETIFLDTSKIDVLTVEEITEVKVADQTFQVKETPEEIEKLIMFGQVEIQVIKGKSNENGIIEEATILLKDE